MTSLGFENYGEALKIYLARYREVSFLERAQLSMSSLPRAHAFLTFVPEFDQ